MSTIITTVSTYEAQSVLMVVKIIKPLNSAEFVFIQLFKWVQKSWILPLMFLY